MKAHCACPLELLADYSAELQRHLFAGTHRGKLDGVGAADSLIGLT
jgi:hypothetical protein